ncbi:cbb3-type cytochrome c oxidase subunit I [Hydrogenibacillus schlegelii]|uniref:cbb3-type cytochrome c oxidase subunit I n=1 Tax=Hydrogenibacillus schlegelii TaxID=1484 RepID=UPI0009E88FC8|nr:cbb3-type cytochrome c oxidase subunit I [Hydrogenibacillus schlegelii]
MVRVEHGPGGSVIRTAGHVFPAEERRLFLAHFIVAHLAFFLGIIAGLLQGLSRTGFLVLPSTIGYYQLLTLHGVALAYVFTTFTIAGFLLLGTAKTTGGSFTPPERRFAWAGFVLMLAGTVLGVFAILSNRATVLYTFYPPMHAHPTFYFGILFVLFGSWLPGVSLFSAYRRWKNAHPGEPSPLFAYMAVATYIMWLIATLGVLVELVVQLIPWSLGWVPRIHVGAARTFFWFFGHPVVYFWLLPAYIYWYVNLPRMIGGEIFSHLLPRLTFLLFLLYSIPVGLHHQFGDPGIAPIWKFVQTTLTFFVVIPTLLTVFTVLATFEAAGRGLGATRPFAWIRKLPWQDARFLAPVAGMLFFIPGGAGGIINASYQLNTVVHNTLWLPGHFHLTLATTVVLTYFAITFWAVPALTGRAYTSGANRAGIAAVLLWSTGMLLMSTAMHVLGVLGEPRRTAFATYAGAAIVERWAPWRALLAGGAVLLFLGALVYLAAVAYLFLFAPRAEAIVDFPIGDVRKRAPPPPPILERWGLWVALAVALILIAYTGPFIELLTQTKNGAPPLRTW